MLCQLSYAVRSARICDVLKLSLGPWLSVSMYFSVMYLWANIFQSSHRFDSRTGSILVQVRFPYRFDARRGQAPNTK